mmetsp:Transcript_15643/g.50400  ORF Transcript_15643/g.50400 Transcript_15643/m.50400 type:complete len:291 (-) Transcript_15643:294-1166(-)
MTLRDHHTNFHRRPLKDALSGFCLDPLARARGADARPRSAHRRARHGVQGRARVSGWQAQPGDWLLGPAEPRRLRPVEPGPGGGDRLPAPRRAEARTRCDGCVCRLLPAVERRALPVGVHARGHHLRRHRRGGRPRRAVGRSAHQREAADPPADRLLRASLREHLCARAVWAEALHARGQAGCLPLPQKGWDPSPGAARLVGPVRLHREDVAGEEGRQARDGAQQRPRRDARHHGLRRCVQGAGLSPRARRLDRAVQWRGDGALLGGRFGAPLCRGHAQGLPLLECGSLD